MAAVVLTTAVKEATTFEYRTTLRDAAGNTIAGSTFNTFRLTYYNKDTGAIINSRNDQDVLQTNNVTISGAGVLVWEGQTADSVIVDSRKELERHVALFKGTWSSGTKVLYHEVEFDIENLDKVP